MSENDSSIRVEVVSDVPAPHMDGFDWDAQEHPCRCGETHTGEWAWSEWGRHNCNHNYVLIQHRDLPGNSVDCPGCGESWEVKEIPS